MRLPINGQEQDRGKSLELDTERETITLLGPAGENFGTVTWKAVVDIIQESAMGERARASRRHPRIPLAVKVRYVTPDGQQSESLTEGIGRGGVFIESGTPVPVGSEITIELALPDEPTGRVEAKGKVVWVRRKRERTIYFPGMGVQFTDISAEALEKVVNLLKTLNQARQAE